MPLDTKFIGKKYPKVKYEIGKEKIKEYAMATGDLNPIYFSDEKQITPPMFAVVYAKEMLENILLDSELEINLAKLLHLEQDFEFYREVYPKDTITTDGEILDIRAKKGISFLTVKTTSYNQNNEIVSVGKWTFVIRES